MLISQVGAGFCCLDPARPDPKHETRIHLSRFHRRPASLAAFQGVHSESKGEKRRSICTADELHRVPVSNSDWKLALWRYLPSPKAPLRNHPLLLLSGVATNAIGYDLSPESSFARYMSAQGFDTWTLEVRGAGLSTHGDNLEENLYGVDSAINGGNNSASSRALGFKNIGTSFESGAPHMKKRGSEVLNGDMLEEGQNSTIASPIKDFSHRLQTILEGQQFLPAQVLDFRERFTAILEEFQRQLELVVKHDWDFDHYLEEDVPAAVRWST